MGRKIALHHRTEYRYDRPVALGPQTIQLRPASHCRTPVLSYSLDVSPREHTLRWLTDALSNQVARVNVPGRTDLFAVDVNLSISLAPLNPFAFVLEPGFEQFPFTYSEEQQRDLSPYLEPGSAGPMLRAFLGRVVRGSQPTVNFLVQLNGRVQSEVGYTLRMEHGVQSPENTLAQRSGSCRDSAWLLVEICRHLGIAARFVSGYLIQLSSEGAATGEEGLKVDSADLHAWAEVYLPGAGWIGMDPTSGLFAAEGHIPLACTPTPLQAAAISGTVEPAGVEFSYAMSVARLDEARHPERPLSDAMWIEVESLARRIDEDLRSEDVRLTMGGEPTYVAMDEPEHPQWNVEALGPEKRTLGLALIRALRSRTAPGALLHLGQGKWYPGEALPRWAFHCISRLDGVPVWEDPQWFAVESESYGFGPAEALVFMQALTHRLQVSSADILPAYNPFDEAEAAPAGYVLPLRRRQPAGELRWSSQLWFERPEPLVLSPGDSPIGYRITVGAMPWVAPDTLTYAHEPAPHADRIQLPAGPARRPELFSVEPTPDPLPPVPADAKDATELIRPSLCVEAREGRLHVFLPYVPVIADYLDLVAAVEDTCRYLGQPVWIEGYTPPPDPRIRAFSLTPDPGVLEVNLPPTENWDDLVALNEVLAEEAVRHRLIPGKFGYDGSHLATGGGSHITIGGPTVMDSPILRRPDLLRSMITFWQNHPSLSYLFSGMYVGPTSQYPRVDEARVDALYELEVAFSQLPAKGCEPHILDGLFRNLLVDVTGNGHRAEFCIDKLYPPEGQGLRVGLLELRAFEMAPHPRMGLLQMLLVRALVCLFWKQPFRGGLVRWGTALHDRFMLPHFVMGDFAEVLAHLEQGGYALDPAWFRAQTEFRFPHIGTLAAEGVSLELRQALEPWNVLAEETNSGRTGRSVDSSLERMQVKLTGAIASARYVATCNGRRIPLTPTGALGESVAGIRYRARRLSAALHPTIPVHTPLHFELIDTWVSGDSGPKAGRSLGRCSYYAGPPDGTVHSTRSANAEEARARRTERFRIDGPGTRPATIPAAELNPSFPMTLDLRWPAPGDAQPSTAIANV